MPKRIPGMPPHWAEYILCLVFHLLLPLLPLLIEFISTRRIGGSSLTLAVAMYAIGIGGSSRNRLLFGLTVVVSIIYSVAFGLLLGKGVQDDGTGASTFYASWALVGIFVIHALERYNRHVVDRAPYWEF